MNTDTWELAKQAGDEQALVDLIKEGHPINGGRSDFFPPLVSAVEMDMRRLARLLLDRHADPNITDQAGRTPLHWAATMDRAALCTMLIQAGADSSAKVDGIAPIHYAANTSPDALRALLNAGVDLELRDQQGLSALHWAAQADQPINVAALLVAGANPRALTADGQSPLDVAQGQAKTVLAQYLAEVERQALEEATSQVEKGRKRARL